MSSIETELAVSVWAVIVHLIEARPCSFLKQEPSKRFTASSTMGSQEVTAE
jgi:hypothetical protein